MSRNNSRTISAEYNENKDIILYKNIEYIPKKDDFENMFREFVIKKLEERSGALIHILHLILEKKEMDFRTIYSDMQTGKTNIIDVLALYMSIRFNIPVVIFVQNRNTDLTQLKNRTNNCISEWLTFCNKKYKIDNAERIEYTTKIKNQIYINLYNECDCRKITKGIKKINEYAIILDESDALDNNTEKKMRPLYEKILEKSRITFNVTATPLSTLVHRDCEKNSLYVFPPPSNYKGLSSINIVSLDNKATPCNKINDEPFVKDKNLKPFLETYHNLPLQKVSMANGKMPNYLLMRSGNTIEPQKKIASYIKRKYPDTVVITWNGSVSLSWNQLPREPIQIGKKCSKYKNKTHNFSDIHIGAIISYLQDNYEEQVERIIVLAGKLADRGITFGADNFDICKQKHKTWWHLTDMYYIGANNEKEQHLSNILQCCGRLCGVYDDNISLTLYCNCEDRIKKGYIQHCELIDRAKNSEGKTYGEIFEGMKVSKNKMPKKVKFSNGKINEIIKKENLIDGSDVEYGGWTAEQRNNIFNISSEEEIKSDSSSVKTSTLDPEWQYKSIKKMIKENKNNNQTRFIKQIDCEKQYTKDELLDIIKNAGYKQPNSWFNAITKKAKTKFGAVFSEFMILDSGFYIVRKDLWRCF